MVMLDHETVRQFRGNAESVGGVAGNAIYTLLAERSRLVTVVRAAQSYREAVSNWWRHRSESHGGRDVLGCVSCKETDEECGSTGRFLKSELSALGL